MTLLRNFVKASDSLLCVRKWNGWNAAVLYFGSKVEVPSPPKRPLTGYMIFCKENRKHILKENPSLSSPEQIKILAEKWGQLTKNLKEPFQTSAREGKVLYSELHKKFYENLTEEQKEQLVRLKAEKRESRRQLKLKQALRDSGMPKPPVPAYALFVQSKAKDKTCTGNLSEFIKRVAETWKSLSKDTKKIFEDQSQAEKKRYTIELSEWRAKMLSEGRGDLIKAFLDIKGGRGKLLLNQSDEKRSTSTNTHSSEC